MQWVKKGKIFTPNNIASWWKSHAMAPSAIQINALTLRIYLGCQDEQGISRIGYVDLDSENPSHIQSLCAQPVLDIGEPGTFDDNGLIPGHAYFYNQKVYLYYTGFELGHKVRHFNFGGLAMSDDGIHFTRASQAPILDRSDEGLHARSGQSIWVENGLFHSCYSAGTGWQPVGGKLRPFYDVYYQTSSNGIEFRKKGKHIIACDKSKEHALGRPQLTKLGKQYYVFSACRTLNMRYCISCAVSDDLLTWRRIDDTPIIAHGENGEFDSEMVYYPSVVTTMKGKTFLFYCGNDFGKTGLGYAELLS